MLVSAFLFLLPLPLLHLLQCRFLARLWRLLLVLMRLLGWLLLLLLLLRLLFHDSRRGLLLLLLVLLPSRPLHRCGRFLCRF